MYVYMYIIYACLYISQMLKLHNNTHIYAYYIYVIYICIYTYIHDIHVCLHTSQMLKPNHACAADALKQQQGQITQRFEVEGLPTGEGHSKEDPKTKRP